MDASASSRTAHPKSTCQSSDPEGIDTKTQSKFKIKCSPKGLAAAARQGGPSGAQCEAAKQRATAGAHRDLRAIPGHSFGGIAARTRHTDHHEKIQRPEQITNERCPRCLTVVHIRKVPIRSRRVSALQRLGDRPESSGRLGSRASVVVSNAESDLNALEAKSIVNNRWNDVVEEVHKHIEERGGRGEPVHLVQNERNAPHLEHSLARPVLCSARSGQLIRKMLPEVRTRVRNGSQYWQPGSTARRRVDPSGPC